jgi:hypothetical protein
MEGTALVLAQPYRRYPPLVPLVVDVTCSIEMAIPAKIKK